MPIVGSDERQRSRYAEAKDTKRLVSLIARPLMLVTHWPYGLQMSGAQQSAVDRQAPHAASQPFLARRASRYALIFAFGTSLCLAQTIPKIGAAVFPRHVDVCVVAGP